MINRRLDDFTGFIIEEDDKIPFYASDKQFHFMAEGIGPFAEFNKQIIHCDDNYMHGYTSEGYQIALYAGEKEKTIRPNYTLNPGIYIVSDANCQRYDMSSFMAIEFCGGTLNNLFDNVSAKTFYDEDNCVYKREFVRFNQVHKINIDGNECNMIIFSNPSRTTPEVMDLSVRFEFKKELSLMYINRIFTIMTELCKIMTNRQNIGFDSIQLFKYDDKNNKWSRFAEGIARYNYKSFTQKLYSQNILFEHLIDVLPAIIELIDENRIRKEKYTFDFVPENDDDLYVITNDKIKNLCSSLECEMSFIKDWGSEKNESLQRLIDDVKTIVDNHRESENKLDEKTYSLIFGSIAHWDMSSSEKMYILFQRYYEYMKHYENIMDLKVEEQHINELVKYRNDVTHGRYRNLESDIVATAYILMALSYCLFFTRMKLNDKVILSLVKEKRLL